MNKAIGRDAALPPPRGRRIPAVGSGKDKGEDRPNARDLLATVNSASEGAAATWIAFLGTMAYLAVTLGGVAHVDLLLNNDTTLPFVNVKVPLATFFVMAPLAFVLVHFSLLLQHVMLSRKLGAFEARLEKEEPSRDRSTQHIRDELHSYTFTQVASGKPKGAVVDMAQRLVVSLTLVVFPLLLLMFFQIGFLAYHSEPITWWHRIMLVTDALVVWLLARHLARLDPASEIRLTDWWHATSKFKRELIAGWHRGLDRARSALVSPTSPGARLARRPFTWAHHGGEFLIRAIAPTRVVITVLILFSTCVATLPDDPLDKATTWVARNWLPALSKPLSYCRDIVDDSATRPKDEKKDSGQKSKSEKEGEEQEIQLKKCPEAASATRHAFYPTAYLFENGADLTSGKPDNLPGWSRNLIVTDKDLSAGDDAKEKRISLRGRDLRHATLSRSKLKRADFYGARLAGARLIHADLSAANFGEAKLQRAVLVGAELQGADFAGAELQGANLSWAELQGADLAQAKLQGAHLTGAGLQGADLTGAGLQGADLTEARLQGADLGRAKLQGADLSRAKLQGAGLVEAGLKGADLSRTELQGANLFAAKLQGVDLFGAKLQGANLLGAELQGANLTRAAVWRSDLPGVNKKPVRSDAWDLVTFARLRISAPDDNERKALAEKIAALEKLPEQMAKESAAGRRRPEDTAKRVGNILRPLLEREGDNKWRANGDLRAWCELERRPPPDPGKLSAYLGKLACDDATDKAYTARRLVRRTLGDPRWGLDAVPPRPNAFLEAFKGCPAFDRIPADLKSQLERAARKERDNPAKPADANAPAPAPELPEACASLAGTPATAEPAKP
jgi:uncharacterized protein YjbI with pentapeptide repeats